VGGDVLDGLQRRVSFHVPIQISGPGERGQQDAQRRASGERAHDPGDADAGAEIGAAGDAGVHGFARALSADILEHEIVPLEDARVLAERRRLVLPIVDLADGDLELILRPRRREREQPNEHERARPHYNVYRYHRRSFERSDRVAHRATSLAWSRTIMRDAARGARRCATGASFGRATNCAADRRPGAPLPLSRPRDWCRSPPARRAPPTAA